MEETEQTSPLIGRRKGRLIKQVYSDEDSAPEFEIQPASASPEPEVPGTPTGAPAEGVQTSPSDDDQRDSFSDAADGRPVPRRLRLGATSRGASSEGRPWKLARSPGTQKAGGSPEPKRRRSSSGSSSSASSDEDDEMASDRSASSFASEEESDLDGDVFPSLRRGQSWRGSWASMAAFGVGTEEQFQEALDWCFNWIASEWQAVATLISDAQRQYEIALWDDELTKGGTRHFSDAFFCDPPRALGAQLLPASTPEEKAVVFLDYPNELYKTEFLHLRVVEPRSRRVVLANLLKCAADQQTACREFDKWMEKNKRFFITQEERLNKLFHLRVAEPRGLRKLQHLLLRAEQCGLVERSKSMTYRRAAPQTEEDEKPLESRSAVFQQDSGNGGDGASSSQLLFGEDDSQYSQDGFSGDESHSGTWNPDCSTKGWAALKRSGTSRSSFSTTGIDASLQPQAMRARAEEEQRRRQEHRDAEKKQARRAALRQRWSDLQRLARETHSGPRFHHPCREEHSKAQRFAARGFSFSRFEVVYIRPPQELHGRHRDAMDAYLRQLPRMHKLLAEPHKLALASKYGLLTVTESTDLTSPPTVEKNVDPWKRADAERHWEELSGVFGYAPWEVLATGGSFIPASLALRLTKKAEAQNARAPTEVAREKEKEHPPETSPATPSSSSKKREASATTPQRTSDEASEFQVPRGTPKKIRESLKKKVGHVNTDVDDNLRTPSKAARQHERGSSTSPCLTRTPTSASRLRRGIPAPPVPNKPGKTGTDPQESAAAAEPLPAKDDNTNASPLDSLPSASAAFSHLNSSRPEVVQQEEDISMEVERNDTQARTQVRPVARESEPAVTACEPAATEAGPPATEDPLTPKPNAKTLQRSALNGDKQHRADALRSPPKTKTGVEKERQVGRKFNCDRPRQMKLTDLLRFTLNKVKGKVAFAINSEALRPGNVDDDDSEEEFVGKLRHAKRRLRVDDAPVVEENPSQQKTTEAFVVDECPVAPSNEGGDAAGASNDGNETQESPAANDSTPARDAIDEEVRRQERRRQKHQRKKKAEAARKQRILERRKQMREIVRQMMEYEAEENDEELRDDAEYAAALEELKHRLAKEGDDDEDDLEDSDNEFLEDLIAKPEDADEDERNEDRVAMNMKLQRDLGQREEEVYERMIGRYQRSGKDGGTELTEQEMLELELEERRRNEIKRRKLLGDGAFAGIDIDDWLSDSEDSGADSGTGEEDSEADTGENVVRWATIALDGVGSSTSPGVAGNAKTLIDLASKCQENAARRQKIQMFREQRKKAATASDAMEQTRKHATETKASETISRQPKGDAKEEWKARTVLQQGDSDSDDEMKNLYKSTSKVQAKVINPLQKGTMLRASSCIRFNPNHHLDLELSNSSSRVVAPIFTGFRSGVIHKPKQISPAQPSEARARKSSEQIH